MNRPFIHGINFEERLRTKLETLGCRIYYDQTYDHQYKLDFIVNGFRDVARLPEHIGLQITANKDDVVKQREFMHVQKKSFVVPKAVYLEADPTADLEQGAATLVYAALLALVFNREYRHRRIVGLHLQGLERVPKVPRGISSSEEPLVGKIINFNKEKGYGFIACESRPNNVFFHIRNEVAEDVLAHIETAEEESTGWRQLDIPVTFREKSVIRFGEDKPVAFDIKLVSQEFDTQIA
jgi:hypothetical protein